VLQTASCGGIPGNDDLWDPDSSESADYHGKSFKLNYGDGSSVKGDQYIDNVTIAGFTADRQTFGSATQYTYPLHDNECTADGVLGLGYPSIADFGADPLFASLVRQGSLINPTFSLKLTSSGAEMYVGGANSMLYKGDITYTPVTDPGFWQVSIDDVRVNGEIILKNVPAIFDTGASYIFGGWEQVSKLYRPLGGTLDDRGDFGFYYLPCDSVPTVSFTFDDTMFVIPPEFLILGPDEEGSPNCFGAIVAERESVGFWAIGIPFLQGIYTVFDYNTFQVGFADLV